MQTGSPNGVRSSDWLGIFIHVCRLLCLHFRYREDVVITLLFEGFPRFIKDPQKLGVDPVER